VDKEGVKISKIYPSRLKLRWVR